jgi:hypothetical protein
MKQFNIDNRYVSTVDFDLLTAICVIAQIQLAIRHPKNIGPSRELAEAFARMLQQKVAEVAPESA